ncbi:Transport and Golgi organization 2 [Popillia japonica]|uniref:Transport and Golgi organization 2 n=1 Tax=Popillia japonica TaxID=7064 RepID=A0AAW1MV55_POPJA
MYKLVQDNKSVEKGKSVATVLTLIKSKEMCILFVYTNPNPKSGTFRLIIIANRDEYYARPAQQLTRVEDVIGGRDLEPKRAGGMWLGVSLKRTEDFKFRFGALLNITGDHKQGLKGRGFIVVNYLESETTADKYMNSLTSSEDVLNGYNFVAVEVSQDKIGTHYYSNISKSYTRCDDVPVLGFGNTLFDIPLQKVVNGCNKFNDVINEFNDVNKKDVLLEKLLQLLKCNERHLPDAELEKRQPMWCTDLSCIFVEIDHAGYGSRTHSIIFIDYDWNMEFYEDTMKEPIDIANSIIFIDYDWNMEFYEDTMKEPIDIANPTWLRNVIKASL